MGDPGKAAVDHGRDAVDGQRRLGDICRQDDLRLRTGTQRPVLIFGRQRAVQRQHESPVSRGQGLDRLLDPANLGHPRQKHKNMAGRGPIRENLPDQRFDCLGTGRTDRRVIGQFDRESSPLDSHYRTIVKELRDRLGIERRRHHHDDEVGANVPPDFSQECQGQVGVQAALMELVEHHGADGLEEGIGQQLPVENALSLDPQPGRR